MNKIIVSLTTIKSRISSIKGVLDSILNQSLAPDEINIYVSNKEFTSSDFSDIYYKTNNINVFFVDDIKSHKKYYYAFISHPDDFIITLDDDIIYHPDTIRKLWEFHLKYPNCVICNRGRFISIYEDNITKYSRWLRNFPIDYPTNLVMPTGCLGVLYKPSWFKNDIYHLERITDKDILLNDDVWLKYNEIISKIKVVITDLVKDLNFSKDSQKETLCDSNHKLDATNNAVKKLFNKDIVNDLSNELLDIACDSILHDGRHSKVTKNGPFSFKNIKLNNEVVIAKEVNNEILASDNKYINLHKVIYSSVQKRIIVFNYLDFSDLPVYLTQNTIELVTSVINNFNGMVIDDYGNYLNSIKESLDYYEKFYGSVLYLDFLNDFSNGVFIHGDLNRNNVKISNNEIYLIDFENASLGPKWWDLCYFIADHDFDNISKESLDLLSIVDIKRIIFIIEIRLGRLIRKKMDLVNRERSLKNFINYLKERELCGSEINS